MPKNTAPKACFPRVARRAWIITNSPVC